jgi:hypothetical protein
MAANRNWQVMESNLDLGIPVLGFTALGAACFASAQTDVRAAAQNRATAQSRCSRRASVDVVPARDLSAVGMRGQSIEPKDHAAVGR